jgi:hypothetical protein
LVGSVKYKSNQEPFTPYPTSNGMGVGEFADPGEGVDIGIGSTGAGEVESGPEFNCTLPQPERNKEIEKTMIDNLCIIYQL